MTSHMQTSQKNVAKIGPKPKNNIKKIAFYAGLFSEQREGGWGDGNGELRGLKDYFYIFLAKMFTILSFFYLVRRKKNSLPPLTHSEKFILHKIVLCKYKYKNKQ